MNQPVGANSGDNGVLAETRSWLKRLHMHLPYYQLPIPVQTPVTTNPAVSLPKNSTLAAVSNNLTGLHSMRYGEKIWQRCWSYVSPSPFNPDNEVPLEEPPLRVWDCPGAPQKPPTFYGRGKMLLDILRSLCEVSPRPIVSNNESARDILDKYVYEVLNASLQLRYQNTAPTFDQAHPFRLLSRDEIPANIAHQEIFYPCYARVVYFHHIDPNPSTSGYSDKLLFATPNKNHGNPKKNHPVASEAKLPWSYPTSSLHDIVQGDPSVVIPGTSLFQKGPGNYHPGNAILQQLWGQCKSLGPDVCFMTNLECFYILVRSLPVQEQANVNPQAEPDLHTGFIISSPMKWDDPRVLTCLIGLSFLAIDAFAWEQTIRDILCPQGESKQVGT